MADYHDSRQLQREWEKRAALHLNDSRGVLYGGLPATANQAIGNWHSELVKKYLLPDLPEAACVLDLAAGYGRLSSIVREARPDVALIGVDLSATYSRLYTDNIGNGLCADMRCLPFSGNIFDRVIAVTGLMYLDRGECKHTVQQIIACLKPGGMALFVDPGSEMIRLLRWLKPAFAERGTGGDGFAAAEYLEICKPSGCSVVAKGENFYFTWTLPLLLSLKSRPGLFARLAARAMKQDLHSEGWGRPSLHRWMVIRREA